MTDHHASGHGVIIVEVPAEFVREGTEVEAAVGDAPGDDDIGTLAERLDDAARTQIRFCGDDLIPAVRNGLSRFQER